VTVPGPHLAADDAMELTELLGLLIDWIDSDHGHHLPDSLRRFIGNDAYDTTALRTDLARFQFLLGGDEHPYFSSTDPDA
jgi:hypothetical protein